MISDRGSGLIHEPSILRFVVSGPGNGILALHAATIAVKTTTVQDNAFAGIRVTDQSTAEFTNFTTQRNRLNDINVLNASLAILRENILISGSQGDGADVFGMSILEIHGAHSRPLECFG